MLSTQQIKIIIDAMKPFHPLRIGIFGSVARGINTHESDILYGFQDTVSLFRLIGLQAELERMLGKKVELVSEKYAHPRMKPQTQSDRKIIYEGK
jgi:uncharacterized protein